MGLKNEAGHSVSGSGFDCMACGHAHADTALDRCRDYYLGTPFVVDYRRCCACGLVQQHPRPEDTSVFYRDYPIHVKKGRIFSFFRRMLMRRAYFPKWQVPKNGLLLDYGCGDGWFLHDCRGAGADLAGFEPGQMHAQRLQRDLGIRVVSDSAELLDSFSGKVDVLTMHFVVEHVADLDGLFALASSLVRNDGVFFFTVPNFDSLERRMFGRKWHSLDAPRHISFPGRGVVEMLAQRYGFVLKEENPLPFPNGFAGSVSVALSGHFSYPLFLLALPFAILFNAVSATGNAAYCLRRVAMTTKLRESA